MFSSKRGSSDQSLEDVTDIEIQSDLLAILSMICQQDIHRKVSNNMRIQILKIPNNYFHRISVPPIWNMDDINACVNEMLSVIEKLFRFMYIASLWILSPLPRVSALKKRCTDETILCSLINIYTSEMKRLV